jgi:hypothetical protein
MIFEPIRKYYLQRNSHKARQQKDQGQRSPANFRKATQIGILFHLEEGEDGKPLEQFVKWLESENKKLRILTYFEYHQSTSFSFYFDHFGKEHINQWGKIASHRVEQFLEIEFDFLYCIYTKPEPMFDAILQQCQAKCRIGPQDLERINLYEIMVLPKEENNLAALLHQMQHISEVLKNND